jgi:hypothetical protein
MTLCGRTLALVMHVQGELLLRCEELRDALWALCDAKHEAAEAARLKLAADGSAAEHVALLGTQLTSLVQAELDRWVGTVSVRLMSHGIAVWTHCHLPSVKFVPGLQSAWACPTQLVRDC